MATKKTQTPPPQKNYDHTAADRVDRQRKAMQESGGARVEALLDKDEVARLDAYVATNIESKKPVTPNGECKVNSRRAAIRHLVQQLPAPAGAAKSRKSA